MLAAGKLEMLFGLSGTLENLLGVLFKFCFLKYKALFFYKLIKIYVVAQRDFGQRNINQKTNIQKRNK